MLLRYISTITLSLLFTLNSYSIEVEAVDEVVSAPEMEVSLVGEKLDGEFESEFSLLAEWERVVYGYKSFTVRSEVSDPYCDLYSNAYWSRFYRDAWTKNERIKVLSEIKGIGEATAKKIYYKWPDHLPSTWGGFVDLISWLDEVAAPGIFARVIRQYGRENKRVLGYEYECDDSVTYEEVVEKTVLDRTPKGFEEITVALKVSGGILLEGESETIVFSYDEAGIKMAINSTFNTYKTIRKERVGDTYKIELLGERIKLYPKNSLVGSLRIENGRVFLEIDRNNIKYEDVYGGQLYIDLDLQTKKKVWGLTWIMTHISRAINNPKYAVQLGETKMSIDTGYDLAEDDVSVYIKFSVFYSGSAFFIDGGKSIYRETEVESVRRDNKLL